MSVSPAASAATTPALLTVATLAADDCHVARLVTVCEVPFDIVAFAANCAELPTLGVDPVTTMEVTVGVADVVVAVDGLAGPLLPPPHAHQPNDNAVADRSPLRIRRITGSG